MQFHLDGFLPGDPAQIDAAQDAGGPLPEQVDVLIVGAGPAGLTLASQLAAFRGINTRLIEQKPGPLEVGQADGVACRSVEMFEAFGFSEQVLKESYWVNETSFWQPDPAASNEITRVRRIQDVEDDLSEMPHVILNQARVHDFFLQRMALSARRLVPDYSRTITDLSLDRTQDYPVTVSVTDENSSVKKIQARYVVGCDGARSSVRGLMGRNLEGDSANVAWGVMDVLLVTDFPDIRLKTAIQSAGHGSVLIIPREGGYLVRLYIEMAELAPGERASDRNITADQIIAMAQKIFAPFTLDIKEVAWWSVYEIGQRVCQRFDDVPSDKRDELTPHVFIAGDACHTHSPKAGQGMNVSMADCFNLGWKLAAVLSGRSAPELLHTYNSERQSVARDLIDFDRDMARLFSARQDPNTDVDPKAFQHYFIMHGRYTAGVEVTYGPSSITGPAKNQLLADGLPVGRRFHSAPVIRLSDAKPMQLAHTIKADGRWRIFLFASAADDGTEGGEMATVCRFLETSSASPLKQFTAANDDIDAVIDVRAVFQQSHQALELQAMPSLLLPRKGRFGLIDYEKIFCADTVRGPDIFDLRRINREQGCMVIVRPDQYISDVLALNEWDLLASFFNQVLVAPSSDGTI